jgi:uncharacterized RDD family membrane protein YckC
MSEYPNPYAAPQSFDASSDANGTEVVDGLDAAATVSFGPRAGARILDTVFLSGLSFAGGLIGGVVYRMTHDGPFIPSVGMAIVRSFICGWLYHSLSEWHGGASFGKAMLGLRVLHERGSMPSLTQTMVRDLGYVVDSLFFGLVGYSSMSSSALRQRYGDKWAHTVVVKNDLLPVTQQRGGPQVLSGLLLGAAAHIVVQVLLFNV